MPTIDEILPLPSKDPPLRVKTEGGGGGGAAAKKRYRPKSTFDLLQGGGGGGGHRAGGFRPSHPKYGAPKNQSDGSDAGGGEEETEDADFYDEDYGDGNQEGERQVDEGENYDNYDDNGEAETDDAGAASRGDNSTEILTRDGGLIGDYDDAESLQTVESEHFNLFYRNQFKRFNNNNNRFYLEDELYEGRCHNSCLNQQG